jgi:hypothetical protein
MGERVRGLLLGGRVFVWLVFLVVFFYVVESFAFQASLEALRVFGSARFIVRLVIHEEVDLFHGFLVLVALP